MTMIQMMRYNLCRTQLPLALTTRKLSLLEIESPTVKYQWMLWNVKEVELHLVPIY